MLLPADVLILDEPTNDLDIPTLEILEESLLEFQGALVLVTHDRYLLDRVTNAVLGLDGRGSARLFADYLQWETWRDHQAQAASSASAKEEPHPAPAASSGSRTRRKLSYMEQREYDTLEKRIDEADARLRAAEQQIQNAEVVVDPEALTAALVELEAAKADHHAVYERWVDLTEKAPGNLKTEPPSVSPPLIYQ
jgi:ATP-binding cassette subfamily F protein uup